MSNRYLFQQMIYNKNQLEIERFFDTLDYDNIVNIKKTDGEDSTNFSIFICFFYFILGILTFGIGFIFLFFYIVNHFSSKNKKSQITYFIRLNNYMESKNFKLDKFKNKKIIEKLNKVEEELEYLRELKNCDEAAYNSYMNIKKKKKILRQDLRDFKKYKKEQSNITGNSKMLRFGVIILNFISLLVGLILGCIPFICWIFLLLILLLYKMRSGDEKAKKILIKVIYGWIISYIISWAVILSL